MGEARLPYARGLHKPGPVLFPQHADFDRAGQIPPDEAPFARRRQSVRDFHAAARAYPANTRTTLVSGGAL